MPLILAQKILSCVVRVEEHFGGDYVAQVLVGSSEERILERGHNQLSTWGILGEHNKKSVRAWIDQLVHQSFLEKLRRVQRAAAHARRLASAPRRSDAAAVEAGQAEVEARVARDASSRGKASTATCSSCSAPTAAARPKSAAFRRTSSSATRRSATWPATCPTTHDELLTIHGIGAKKCAEYGDDLLREIADYCERAGAVRDGADQVNPFASRG